uniref:SUMO-activating enzyme subunit n=1 Tax=Caenorhabditis tropicalis TaxID=1561998 RepID=A0A1I7T743_9PELO
MCYAADRPLIESGSSGYLGQVQVIMRGKTECYECQEKPKQVTFPGCTIRNTPSEHIHCTVWSKHAFNQLFGEVDIDDDVSPDMKAEDPEHPNEEPSQEEKEAEVAGAPKPIGTRQWAESVEFDAEKVFDKLFTQDIEYLRKMTHLWKERKQPTPLLFARAMTMGKALSFDDAQNQSSEVWSIATCATVFATCIKELLKELKKSENPLSFDKDHQMVMSFVAACANIRANIFSIQLKSLFDIKAMAGNIIPAIASTNAIVAGMIVTEALKIINGCEGDAKCSFTRKTPNPRGKVFLDDLPYPPNPNCYICSASHRVFIYVNPNEMTVQGLRDKVLKQELNMIEPDVIDGNTFNVVISSDGDTDASLPKKLAELSISNGAVLNCDDFAQDLEVKLFIRAVSHLKGDAYEVSRVDEEEKKDKAEKEEARKRKVGDEVEPSEEPDAKRAKENQKEAAAAMEIM